MNTFSHRRQERGYVLLVLLLFVALLAIGSLAVLQDIHSQVKRDREEELIHRGVQYSRAVRRYFKKFGRYPTRIEDLESTNNYRSLRKRYKDPMNRDPATGKEKDFKPLHMTDVQVSFNPGAASGIPPGPDANISAQQPTGVPGTLNSGVAATAGAGAGSMPQEAQAGGQAVDQSTASVTQENQPPQVNNSPLTQIQAQGANGLGPGNRQVFGGGAIIGVASANTKDRTIREFCKLDHYNKWQFIYDPSTDRGGLLMTPNQACQKTMGPLNQPQQNGQPGQNPGFGQNSPPQQPPVSQPPEQQQQ